LTLVPLAHVPSLAELPPAEMAVVLAALARLAMAAYLARGGDIKVGAHPSRRRSSLGHVYFHVSPAP